LKNERMYMGVPIIYNCSVGSDVCNDPLELVPDSS
jgi:hypothetical protein